MGRSLLPLFVCIAVGSLPRAVQANCEENCQKALGMMDGRIKDYQLKAANAFNDDWATYGPSRARLNLTSWAPGYRGAPVKSQWFMIDLEEEMVITGLATQGYGDTAVREWVKSYHVLYSKDGNRLHLKNFQGDVNIFSGNKDSNTVQLHDVPVPVVTSSIVFVPVDTSENFGLRMELYGCKPGYYFSVWLMFADQYFTLEHANSNSEEYKIREEEVLALVTEHLQYFPGYLSAELERLSPHQSALGATLLTTEINIYCVKTSAKEVAAKILREIEKPPISSVEKRYPLGCECTPPKVKVFLNKTLEEAQLLFTTQELIIHASVSKGNCSFQDIKYLWEISKATKARKEFGPLEFQEEYNRSLPGLTIRGSSFSAGYLYIRCVAKTLEDKAKAYDYGYVRVALPPLVARISGHRSAVKGNGSVILNASESLDPSLLLMGIEGMRFSWYCRRMDDAFSLAPGTLLFEKVRGGCYGRGPGKLTSTKPLLRVNVDEMDSNQTYVFELVVAKDSRVSRAVHHLTVLPPFVITLRCTVNCARKVSTNKRMVIESVCRGPFCRDVQKYNWFLYKMDPSAIDGQWIEVPYLKDMILTDLNSANLVYSGKGKRLHVTATYKVKASVLLREGIAEHGETMFFTNSPPYNHLGNLGCSAYPREGRVLQTSFNVTCLEWQDVDVPLMYQLSLRSSQGPVILAKGPSPSVMTLLPLGKQSEDYNVKLEMQISDSLGDVSTVTFTVKVEPLSESEMSNAVKAAVDGPNSTASQLLKSGDVGQAALISCFALTAVDNTEIPYKKRNSVKDVVLEQFASAKPRNLEEVTSLSAVVNSATGHRTNMTLPSVTRAVSLLESTTNTFVEETVGNQEVDILEQVGKGLLHGMSNVLDVSAVSPASGSKTFRTLNKEVEQGEGVEPLSFEKKGMIEASVHLMDKLGSSLLSLKVVGETKPMALRTGSVSMLLDRQTPSKLAGKTLKGERSESTVIIPSTVAISELHALRDGILDAQMITFQSNPYTWDNSSMKVTSTVVEFSLKTSESSLDISGLRQPFELFIQTTKRKENPINPPRQHFFLKPSEGEENIRYHKISIPSDSAVAIIEIIPQKNISLEIYVSAGARPTLQSYGYTTNLPNSSPYCNYTLSGGNINCSSKSPYTFYLSSSLTGNTGKHFIGIVMRSSSYASPENSTTGETVNPDSRPSCGSKSGREKRSCIGLKDPPTTPPPTPKNIMPTYSASNDVNYSISISVSGCLYWSVEKEKWTSEGCTAGPQSRPEKIHCLCTHLSSFGGDFFVAPNPIDFDKIWMTPVQPKEFVVLVVVCCIYGLYLVGLVFARRADIKDREKVVGNVFLNSGNEEGCLYEVYIQTGIWKGFGTTANVGIIIFGEEGSSGPVTLTDSSLQRKVFSRGSVNNFSVFLPRNLGRLVKIRIWHDNFGDDPSWFLQQVIITDPQTTSQWYFFANKWLALERGSGNICLELNAVERKESPGIKHLFFSRASKSLGDEHLWISVFSRPPHSPFTRSQRLSCCLSLIFTSMVTSAMFYQFNEKPTETFKLGPLLFSWIQVKIGIQSGLIVVPINVLIVVIFRNIKIGNSGDLYSPSNGSTSNTRSGRLPRCFLYIAWTVCLLTSLASSLFTVFYSLMWGPDLSIKWLTSIVVSLIQDVLFIQPIKVIILAISLSIISKKLPEKETVNGTLFYVNNDVMCKSPEGLDLAEARERVKRLLEMFKTLSEITSFSIFIILLMVVCYGNRDSRRYLVTDSLRKIFRGFDKVRDSESFWKWSRQILVPGLYNTTWYNGKPFDHEEGFISNRGSFLVGMPRLRQIRIRPATRCPGHIERLTAWGSPLFQRCLPLYSSKNEDKTPFNRPKWIPVTNESEFISEYQLDELCPKPWRYQSPKSLQTRSYQGHVGMYDGGGYVADLGYNGESASNFISDLRRNNWVDELTVAIFVEFFVYESSSSLFCFGKYVYEKPPSGGVLTTTNLWTLALYPSSNPSSKVFQEICQLLFVVFIVVLLFTEIGNILQQKVLYVTQVWNWIRALQILTSVCAVVVLFLKANFASAFIRNVQRNPYETCSPDNVILWCDIENYLLAVVIFLVTLLFLRLTRFNPHVCQMAGTLRRAGKSLASFSVVFVTTLLAYSLMGHLAFGVNIASFSSFFQSLRTVVQMSIGGKVNFPEVQLQHKTLSPLFMSSFAVWMVLLLVNTFVAILIDFYKVERKQPVALADAFLATFIYSYFSDKVKRLFNSLWSNVQTKLGNKSSKPSKNIVNDKVLSQALFASEKITTVDTRRRSCYETGSCASFKYFCSFQDDESSLASSYSGSPYVRHLATSSDHSVGEHAEVPPTDGSVKDSATSKSNSSDDLDIVGKTLCEDKTSVARLVSEETLPVSDNISYEGKHAAANIASLERLLSIDDVDITHARACFCDVALELKKIHFMTNERNSN